MTLYNSSEGATLKYIAVSFIVILTYFLFFYEKNNQKSEKKEEIIVRVADKEKNIIRASDPKWKKWTAVREVSDPNLGVVLGDLESHLPKGHKYIDDNKITWAHQTTHGINALIRNQINNKEPCNGFYVLQDRALVIKEPNINLKDVAVEIPEKLRGPSYNIYLNEQQEKWNDRPLYLFDEWIAFTNGAEVGKELNCDGWYYELFQAHNFNVYCLYMAMVLNRDVSNYNDVELKKLLMWNTERVFAVSIPSDRNEIDKIIQTKIVNLNTNHFCPHCRMENTGKKIDLKKSKEYVELIRTLPEGEKLRQFSRQYFGEDWCKRIYGF